MEQIGLINYSKRNHLGYVQRTFYWETATKKIWESYYRFIISIFYEEYNQYPVNLTDATDIINNNNYDNYRI